MLRDEDLEAAVEAGIITTEQQAAMNKLAGERRSQRVFARGREERFRILGGFNDFFVAVGVVLLGIGLSYGWSFGYHYDKGVTIVNFAGIAAWHTVSMLVMWGLAEFLTARSRLVAPSIVIVIWLAIFAGVAGWAWASVMAFGGEVQIGRSGGTKADYAATALLAGCASALAAVCLHYGRFRLPFSLFAIAASLVILLHVIAFTVLGKAGGMSQEQVWRIISWLALVVGLGVFAWAMSYDVADPERTSRRADCGFWLHLLAAPLIVHPLAAPLIVHPFFSSSGSATGMTGITIAMVFALVAALSTTALIIDRRALLVAGLGYLGAAMAYTLSKITGGTFPTAIATLVLLGLLIIVLGTGWHGLRTAVMRALPPFPGKARLPPYAATA